MFGGRQGDADDKAERFRLLCTDFTAERSACMGSRRRLLSADLLYFPNERRHPQLSQPSRNFRLPHILAYVVCVLGDAPPPLPSRPQYSPSGGRESLNLECPFHCCAALCTDRICFCATQRCFLSFAESPVADATGLRSLSKLRGCGEGNAAIHRCCPCPRRFASSGDCPARHTSSRAPQCIQMPLSRTGIMTSHENALTKRWCAALA